MCSEYKTDSDYKFERLKVLESLDALGRNSTSSKFCPGRVERYLLPGDWCESTSDTPVSSKNIIHV